MEGYPECPICLDIYGIDQSHIRAPKVLNCGDTLCKECLGKIMKKSIEEFFECPECKDKLKKQDIDEFITNKEIIRLVNGIFNIPKEEAENEIENNKPISYKIISLGSAGVGKTSIFGRLITDKFIEKYTITIGIDISKAYYVKYKNIKYKLLFCDTCGQERMASQIPKNYLRNSDGVLFIFDISNIGTFNDLKNWYDFYKAEKENNIVGVLIGNKCDIERQVSYDEAKKFADEHGLEYFEISAKLDINVKKSIAVLLNEIIESTKHYDRLSLVKTKTRFSLDARKLKKESFFSRVCKKLNPKNW
jgi:small GTP-binding protein